jgi:hypothetical protein
VLTQSAWLAQVVRHAPVVPQRYGEHELVIPAGQSPALQKAAAVWVLPLQLGVEH